jgi:hypothetical protein
LRTKDRRNKCPLRSDISIYQYIAFAAEWALRTTLCPFLVLKT